MLQFEEEVLARDVLDYVYMALRASMLLIILYYYSSTYRILGTRSYREDFCNQTHQLLQPLV